MALVKPAAQQRPTAAGTREAIPVSGTKSRFAAQALRDILSIRPRPTTQAKLYQLVNSGISLASRRADSLRGERRPPPQILGLEGKPDGLLVPQAARGAARADLWVGS
jgi:hypothetical protein